MNFSSNQKHFEVVALTESIQAESVIRINFPDVEVFWRPLRIPIVGAYISTLSIVVSIVSSRNETPLLST